MGGKKKPDIGRDRALKMSPAQIIRELRRGKTISGYSDYLAEHMGKDMVRDVREKDIKNLEKKLGSYWHEGTVRTGITRSTLDSARELFGKNGKASPPPGRSTWW